MRHKAEVQSVVWRAALPVVCAACWLLCAAPAHGSANFGREVLQKDSLYHRIYVYQRGSVMTLRFACADPYIIQSSVDLANPRRHMNEYTTLSFAGLLYNPEPARMLVVGLGGGVIPQDVHHYLPDLPIDVAEIDPDIPPIAEKYFGFRADQKMRVHVADGRVFIRQQSRREPPTRYDIIVLDAFQGEYIPFHLMTREFMEEVKGALTEGGVVVANVIQSNRLAHAELRTVQEVFDGCQVFAGERSTNAMIVGFGPGVSALTPQTARERAAELQRKHAFGFDVRTVARRLVVRPRADPDAKVLTDDQAPVNWLRWQGDDVPLGEPDAPDEEPESDPEEDPTAGEGEQ